MWPAHLADVVPEDGLVLRASDLPLEPGLRLAIVGDLQGGGAVTDLGQVGHGVSDRDGPVDASVASVRERHISVPGCCFIYSEGSRPRRCGGYRVTLLTYFFSSTATLSEQALGANTCRGSG